MQSSITVAALYYFSDQPILDLASKQTALRNLGQTRCVLGTLLIAPEGINGTIAGTETDIIAMISLIESLFAINHLSWKRSVHDSNPFHRFKVKIKSEIVTLGQNSQCVASVTGKHIAPKDWNAVISDPDTIVLDTRNDYETAIGTFKNALDPKTKNFRDFPDYVKANLEDAKHKKIAMFFTGGIRCEKASNFLIEQGFTDVCQLKGGILQYFEDIEPQDSLWQGECFVFDNRVAVDQSLEKGQYDQCYACRLPITEPDKKHPHYQAGISCHHCYTDRSPEQKKRYAQRQKQQELAKSRGYSHIGPSCERDQSS